MADNLCVYHICSTGGNPSNGMVTVIPEHVKAQSRYINTCLINLKNFNFPNYQGVIRCLNDETLDSFGMTKIEAKYGKPDLYVIHGLYLPQIWKFWKKYIYKKLPYIIIPHGTLTTAIQKRHRLKKILANILIVNKMVKNARAIQFLSDGEKSNSILHNKKTIVCPNGIDVPADNLYSPKDNINLVYIGRIDVYHKGLDLLLGGIKKCHCLCTNNNVKVMIFGPTNSSDYVFLSNMIREYKIEDITELHGPVFGEDKKKILLNATYFIQTSRLEGLPMGILEAISYGIPILVTEGTFFGDVVRKYDNGHVVDTSVDGVSELIMFAIHNIYRLKTMSKHSRECIKNYSWDIVGKKEVELYKNIQENEK